MNRTTKLRTVVAVTAGLLSLAPGVASAAGGGDELPSLRKLCQQQGGRLIGADSVAPQCVHVRVRGDRLEEAAHVCEVRRGSFSFDVGNGRRGSWTCDLGAI